MTAPQTPLVSGSYRIDPEASKVEFTVRYLFGLRSATGAMSPLTGQVTVADTLTDSVATGTVPTAGFTTGSTTRDNHVKTADFLDAANHPTLTFRSTEITDGGTGWRQRGELVAHGVTAPVDWMVENIDHDTTGATIQVAGQVDRHAHGVSNMKGMVGQSIRVVVAARIEPAGHAE